MTKLLLGIGCFSALAASAGCYARVSGGYYEPNYYVRRGHYVDVSPGVRAYHINGGYHTYDSRSRAYVRYNRPVVRARVIVR